jgi:hypothetical protein
MGVGLITLGIYKTHTNTIKENFLMNMKKNKGIQGSLLLQSS